MANKNAPDWGRLKTVLQEALEKPPEAWALFLDQACGGDQALRSEVESLLAAHEEAGEFLSMPAADTGLPLAEGRPQA